MFYRDDWDKIKERHSAFWRQEIVDRCCISVTASKKGNMPSTLKKPTTPEEFLEWRTDGEIFLKGSLHSFENTYFAGDAFAKIMLDFGASGHAAYFKGAKYQVENTIWFFPTINDWEKDFPEFDPDSFLYKKTFEIAKYLVNESKGRYVVTATDGSGNADALAHLRGSENLLMDLFDEEEIVKKALSKIQAVWEDTNEKIHQIIKDNNDGGSSIGWLSTWAPGRHAQMQCDMSVMISPELYEKFIMPELYAQARWMDYSLYHFDGIEQLRHLDMLLSIKELSAIQWTSVAGQPSPVKFLPQLKKIQAAGKSLLINDVTLKDAEVLIENLSSKGLYLALKAASQEEADAIVKKAEKLTHE